MMAMRLSAGGLMREPADALTVVAVFSDLVLARN